MFAHVEGGKFFQFREMLHGSNMFDKCKCILTRERSVVYVSLVRGVGPDAGKIEKTRNENET